MMKTGFTESAVPGHCSCFVIDFTDMNVWGIFAMPVGLALCFGPALIVWWLTEGRADARPVPNRAKARARH